MTAPAFVNSTTAGNGTGTNVAVTRASTTTDHYNVIDVYVEDTPAGLSFTNGTWTLIGSAIAQNGPTPDFRHFRYREKYAGAGASVTVSGWTGTPWRTATCVAYSGVDTTTAEDTTATGAASGSASASAAAPTLTTVTADAKVVYSETNFDGNTATPPSTYTERVDFGNVEVSDLDYATAGATGAQTGTVSAASWNTAGLYALRPSAAGGPFSLSGGPTLAPASVTGTLAENFALSGGSTLAQLSVAGTLVWTQLALPVSDGAVGGWTTETGATTNEYLSVAEIVPSDLTYVQSTGTSTGDSITFALGTLATPTAGNRILHYRYDKPAGTLTVELLQGASVVQTWTHLDVPADWAGADQLISGTITDYSNLSVRLTATT